MVQVLFFRCVACSKVVSPWDIEKYGGCKKCGHATLRTTNLSLIEEIIQFIKHPKFWKYKDVKQPSVMEV